MQEAIRREGTSAGDLQDRQTTVETGNVFYKYFCPFNHYWAEVGSIEMVGSMNLHVFQILFQSVQFSHTVVSDYLRPHGLQHAWLPCQSPTPEAYSNSHPLHRPCHPTISSSVVPFPSHLQSFPASGSFPMSQFFTIGGLNIGASASASVLPVKIQC